MYIYINNGKSFHFCYNYYAFLLVNVRKIMDPDNQVLIEGVLFRARYLGSTQLVTDGSPTKLTRMLQAQEAVGRIKVRVFN